MSFVNYLVDIKDIYASNKADFFSKLFIMPPVKKIFEYTDDKHNFLIIYKLNNTFLYIYSANIDKYNFTDNSNDFAKFEINLEYFVKNMNEFICYDLCDILMYENHEYLDLTLKTKFYSFLKEQNVDLPQYVKNLKTIHIIQ